MEQQQQQEAHHQHAPRDSLSTDATSIRRQFLRSLVLQCKLQAPEPHTAASDSQFHTVTSPEELRYLLRLVSKETLLSAAKWDARGASEKSYRGHMRALRKMAEERLLAQGAPLEDPRPFMLACSGATAVRVGPVQASLRQLKRASAGGGEASSNGSCDGSIRSGGGGKRHRHRHREEGRLGDTSRLHDHHIGTTTHPAHPAAAATVTLLPGPGPSSRLFVPHQPIPQPVVSSTPQLRMRVAEPQVVGYGRRRLPSLETAADANSSFLSLLIHPGGPVVTDPPDLLSYDIVAQQIRRAEADGVEELVGGMVSAAALQALHRLAQAEFNTLARSSSSSSSMDVAVVSPQVRSLVMIEYMLKARLEMVREAEGSARGGGLAGLPPGVGLLPWDTPEAAQRKRAAGQLQARWCRYPVGSWGPAGAFEAKRPAGVHAPWGDEAPRYTFTTPVRYHVIWQRALSTRLQRGWRHFHPACLREKCAHELRTAVPLEAHLAVQASAAQVRDLCMN